MYSMCNIYFKIQIALVVLLRFNSFSDIHDGQSYNTVTGHAPQWLKPYLTNIFCPEIVFYFLRLLHTFKCTLG